MPVSCILRSEAPRRLCGDILLSNASFLFLFVCLLCGHECGRQRFTWSTFPDHASPGYLRQSLSHWTWSLCIWQVTDRRVPVTTCLHLPSAGVWCILLCAALLCGCWLVILTLVLVLCGWCFVHWAPINASYLGMISSLISYLTLKSSIIISFSLFFSCNLSKKQVWK